MVSLSTSFLLLFLTSLISTGFSSSFGLDVKNLLQNKIKERKQEQKWNNSGDKDMSFLLHSRHIDKDRMVKSLKKIQDVRGGISIGPLTPTIGFYIYCLTTVFYFVEVLVRPGPMLKSFTDMEFNALTIFLDTLLHSAMLVISAIAFYFRKVIGIQNAVRCSLLWAIVDFIGQFYARYVGKFIKSNEGVIGTFVFMVVLAILQL